MWSWNQFRNLPKNQGLSPQEQARQYFIHQSNMIMEASFNNAAASSAAASSAAAGAGAGGRIKPSTSTDFLIFGVKEAPEIPGQDYRLFNVESNGVPTLFMTDGFFGPTVFANNTDDGFKYFLSRNLYDLSSPILFGKMDDSGNLTYLDIDIVESIGGAIGELSFSLATLGNGFSVAGTSTYSGLTGSGTGSGYGASFDIIVSGATVSSVLLNGIGDLYKPGDTISINASNFGGTSSQSITITVDSVRGASSPTSMYYLGENQFICLDRFLFFDNQYNTLPKTYKVDTYFGTTTLLSIHNDDNYPTSLFQYNGEVWGVYVVLDLFFSIVSKYDINTGLFDTESINQVVVNNIPNISMSKVLFVISAVNINDRIYCNLLVRDKETNNVLQCIAELNVETGEADYLYSIDLDLEFFESSEYLYTNIINR
jgi:hypothetical protein